MRAPKPPNKAAASSGAISLAAARWVVLRDRGLSAGESAEFERWLAADQRHREAIGSSTAAWGLMERLSADIVAPCGKARSGPRISRILGFTLAAAASIALAYVGWLRMGQSETSAAGVAAVSAAAPRMMLLTDGTLVSLNNGAEVVEQFTPSQRRVLLSRGEAHFNVKKNAAWPFIVRAGTVEVAAVGTAFDVDLQSSQIEVVVTEGKVRVASDVSANGNGPSASLPEGPLVKAGQQALATRRHFYSPWSISVSESDPENLSRILAWKDPLTCLTGATLGDLAADFQRRIGYRLILADPELAALRIGGRFRVEDVDDLVRLLADNFGLEAQHTGTNETVLRLRK